MIPKDLTKHIKVRLQSIKGQVDGLIRMLDEGKDPEKILIQFKAAPEPGVDVLNSLLQKFKEDSLQKPVRSKYTSECLMLAWADHNLANVDPPLTFITANMFRHVYATNLYYAWYNQDATGMDGKPNPFLDSTSPV